MTLLIKNAEIYDGRGKEPFTGDIFVSGDRISAIGNIPARHAKEMIDGQGLKVCPGFIDAFSKTDHYCGILDEPEQKEFLRNGITSVIGGQEGVSLAPLFPGNWSLIEEWCGRHRNLGWHSMEEFLEYLGRRPLGVNFGTLVGYETIRRVFPATKKNLSKTETAFLGKILKTAIAEGGLGLSLRKGEDEKRTKEAKAVIDAAGRKIKIIDAAVTPFVRHIVPARTFLPQWLDSHNPKALKDAVSDYWLRSKIIRDISDIDSKRLTVVQAPGHDSLTGNTLHKLSNFFHLKDPKEALVRLLVLTGFRALAAYPAISPEALRAIFVRTDVLLGTAGASFGPGRKPKAVFVDENASALSYFLSLTAAEGLMPLAAAVHKITALPAQVFELKDRGEILEGKFADIIGFSLDPRSYEVSVKFAVLNGKLVMKEGEFLDSAGKILTRT